MVLDGGYKTMARTANNNRASHSLLEPRLVTTQHAHATWTRTPLANQREQQEEGATVHSPATTLGSHSKNFFECSVINNMQGTKLVHAGTVDPWSAGALLCKDG
jgi:hypothetical protein